MAELNLVNFIECTSAEYAALTTKDDRTLYFCSDTNEIYKGNTKYSQVLENNSGVEADTLRIKTSDNTLTQYDGVTRVDNVVLGNSESDLTTEEAKGGQLTVNSTIAYDDDSDGTLDGYYYDSIEIKPTSGETSETDITDTGFPEIIRTERSVDSEGTVTVDNTTRAVWMSDIATTGNVGVVKPDGNTLSVDSDGVLSVNTSSDSEFIVYSGNYGLAKIDGEQINKLSLGSSRVGPVIGFSVGENAYASGDNTVALGQSTTAQRKNQLVFGRYNILDTEGADTDAEGAYSEIVGNGGTSSNRSNARTLDWDGNEVLAGSITPNGGIVLGDNTVKSIGTGLSVDTDGVLSFSASSISLSDATGTLPITKGGTGGTTAIAASTNLGFIRSISRTSSSDDLTDSSYITSTLTKTTSTSAGGVLKYTATTAAKIWDYIKSKIQSTLIATTSALGVVKPDGTTITVDDTGVISASSSSYTTDTTPTSGSNNLITSGAVYQATANNTTKYLDVATVSAFDAETTSITTIYGSQYLISFGSAILNSSIGLLTLNSAEVLATGFSITIILSRTGYDEEALLSNCIYHGLLIPYSNAGTYSYPLPITVQLTAQGSETYSLDCQFVNSSESDIESYIGTDLNLFVLGPIPA